MSAARTILIIASMFPALSFGQIKILADTLSNSCRYKPGNDDEIFIIASQKEYDDAVFVNSEDDQGCDPFPSIDFDTSVLVGCKFSSSNCDTGILWAKVIETDQEFVVQFVTSPRHGCHDMNHDRVAWFLLNRLPGKTLSFERVD